MLTLRLSYLFLALALFAVVLVAPSTFFPFIGVKAYWFRILVSAAAAAFLWWWGFAAPRDAVRERLRRVVTSPLVWAVTAFVAVFLISTVLARDPALAFWSNFERGEGGFAMLYLYAFFLLLPLIVRDERLWRGLLWVSVVAALLVVGYGVLAMMDNPEGGKYFMGPYGFYGAHGVLVDRFAGSLGNPIYVGSYLLFVFFYLGALFDGEKRKMMCWLLVALAALFLAFFVLSQGRGAMAGLAAGLLAGLAFAGWAAQGRRRIIILCVLAAALLTLLAGTAALRYSYKNSAAVRATPIVSRIARASLLSPLSSDLTRLYAWRTAWQAFLERPLFGWGPENFTEVFDRNFDIRHFKPGIPSNTWYDRAHSIVFDYLAELGAIGLAAFLSIFAAFYVQFFRFWDRRRIWAGALWFAFPVAYLVQGVAIFDIFPIYIQLFFFLAYATHVFRSK